MSSGTLAGLLQDLGDSIGVAGLAPDAQGYCLIGIGEVLVTMQHEPERDELLLFTRLAVVPEPLHAAACIELLSANLFWIRSGGATFAFEPAEGAVYLQAREPMRVLDTPAFRRLLEGFVETAEAWTARLMALAAAPESAATEPPEPPLPVPGALRA
jgi:hypothetical protein